MSMNIRVETSFGNNVNNSNWMKRGRKLETVWKSDSDVKVVQEYGKKMQEQAKADAPYKTGNLRDNAIKLEMTKTGFLFYVDDNIAPYGKWLERGAGRLKRPRPFYWPAVDRNKTGLLEALRKHYTTL